jgi:hypothetical protein
MAAEGICCAPETRRGTGGCSPCMRAGSLAYRWQIFFGMQRIAAACFRFSKQSRAFIDVPLSHHNESQLRMPAPPAWMLEENGSAATTGKKRKENHSLKCTPIQSYPTFPVESSSSCPLVLPLVHHDLQNTHPKHWRVIILPSPSFRVDSRPMCLCLSVCGGHPQSCLHPLSRTIILHMHIQCGFTYTHARRSYFI